MLNSQELLLKIQMSQSSDGQLTLSGRSISDGDIPAISAALEKNTEVKNLELDLSNNNISDSGAQVLAKLSLKTLDVSGNNIKAEGANALIKGNFQKLNISANPIIDKENPITILPTTIALTELIATGCNITDEEAAQLFQNTTIKKLDLSGNEITGECLEALASNTALLDLDLSQNNLLGKYFHNFSINSNLVGLNLTNVFVRKSAVIELSKNQSLKELILVQCMIDDISAFANNKTLKKLVLLNNHIEQVEVLRRNVSLLHLDLRQNPLINDEENNLEKYYQENNNNVFTRTEEFITVLLTKVSDEHLSSNSERFNTLTASEDRGKALSSVSQLEISPFQVGEKNKQEVKDLTEGERDRTLYFGSQQSDPQIYKKGEIGKRKAQILLSEPVWAAFFGGSEAPEMTAFFESLKDFYIQSHKKKSKNSPTSTS